jgi:cytochrome c553
VDDDGIHGKASKLSAETKVRGPITSIDLTNGIIVVLGQTILITADTFYEDGFTAGSLKVGDVVKVSSYTNADSALVATRVEVKTGTEAKDLFLAGAVADLNTTAMTFTINGTTVDYSKATISDLPNKTLSNGMLVRVHGKVVNGIFVASGNVHSSILDIKHDGELDTKANIEIGGLISLLNIPTGESLVGPSFVVDGTKVFFAANVKINGGAITDLANGLRVRVKGKLNADRNLVAEKITLILKTKVDDEGLVQATDLTKNTLTLNGVTFEVTVDTSFNDRSKADVRLFSLKDIVTGDFINVRGYKVAATASTPERIVATRVERKNPSEKSKDGFKTEISGKIESVLGDIIKVSGHSIKVTDATILSGFNNVQAFLAGALGLSVEVKGVIENDVFIARTIKLEDDEDSESEHSKSSKSSSSKSSSSKTSSASLSSASSSKTSSTSVSSASSSKTSVASSTSSLTSVSSSSASSVAFGNAVLGQQLYDAATYNCAGCHGAKGASIAINKNKTVESLAIYITANMPPSNKGACNTQCGKDIATYIKTW